ncbi:hypothetical protein BBO99_00003469 [Phytophthora kernoviae]|uniref:EH domain-containing protein n=1 Tax=Phytophthora kernoviae TaxID=325452 RepID=A0A3R7HK66_9STRA|nr:hypothetical protein JM18_007402 [Phytophthora kernoviae]KAG2525819.1 hypothetical protein JM16_003155 [Phytophthora kernoviae]RLN13726.1 hypothetical protein BBI17_003475 [Phytophthora kernoviae]RLN81742.1 hypothetical protein BBO99_00003469 [Phytophthora kernoviae]
MSFASFPDPNDDVQLDTPLYTMIELEGSRYRAFFSKLAGSSPLISRGGALEFFRKSSLSEDQVQELYNRLKALQLLRDGDNMNETEFIMGMHFIVCMTKRNLVKIPPKFPNYLFPTLDLTPERRPSVNNNGGDTAGFGFPSPSVLSDASKASSEMPLVPPPPATATTFGMSDPPISFIATSPMTLETPLLDAKSLSELVQSELRSKQHEAEVLSRMDQSEARALQSLQSCVGRIAEQVDTLGFPVPSSSRSLDALDDLRNLLEKHVHAAKQEIQSMQIDAQMRSVASEVTQSSGSRQDPMKLASSLTREMMALQYHTAQLMAKKEDVVKRIVDLKNASGSMIGSAIERASAPSFAGGAEARNPAFALSKGALTVGELDTASETTTPPKHLPAVTDPSPMHSNNGNSGGWGTFGTAKSQDPPPPAPFGAKTDNSLAANDPFGFGASPVVTAKPTGATEAKTSANDFAWGSFQ